MKFDWLQEDLANAVEKFWRIRDGGAGVQTGKTLSAFVPILTRVIEESGLRDVSVYSKMRDCAVPGYFRTHKNWDLLLCSGSSPLAVFEFKSQVGSIGKNSNNRSEEVLGNALDLQTAVEENAFRGSVKIFRGYLMVIEDGAETRQTPKIEMNYFRPMQEFYRNESREDARAIEDHSPKPNGKFPWLPGVSYLERYDLLCRRMMLKNRYDAAAVMTVPSQAGREREHGRISAHTSIETFLAKLSAHCEVQCAVDEQEEN